MNPWFYWVLMASMGMLLAAMGCSVLRLLKGPHAQRHFRQFRMIMIMVMVMVVMVVMLMVMMLVIMIMRAVGIVVMVVLGHKGRMNPLGCVFNRDAMPLTFGRGLGPIGPCHNLFLISRAIQPLSRAPQAGLAPALLTPWPLMARALPLWT